MSVLTVDRLTKRYGAVSAVDDLSFSISAGRVVGFLGPNGAGKTTTISCLLGLARPTAGTALVRGRPYAELDHPARVVGAVLDAGGLHPGRSGRDHLRVQAAAIGVRPARVDEVIERVGLGDAAHRRVKGYSLGMRQRLGLATALLGDPGILILDEPANGLDPAGMRELRNMLRAFADDGGTVLLSSHVLAEVAQTVDELVIIGHGRLIAHTSLAELTADATLEDAYLQLTALTEGMR